MVKTSAVPTEQSADDQFRVVGFNPATNSTAAIRLNRVKEVLGLALTADFEEAVASIRSEMDYRLSTLAFGLTPKGSWTPAEGAFPANATEGDYWLVSEDGTLAGESFTTGNWLIAKVNNPPTGVYSGWEKTDWVKVWTEHNDGAGSGLDADLLDGLEASDFVPKVSATPLRIEAETAVLTLTDGSIPGEAKAVFGRVATGGNTISPLVVKMEAPAAGEIPQFDLKATLARFLGNISVAGDAEVTGAFVAQSPATFHATVNMQDSLSVAGDVTVNGDLKLAGTGNDPMYFANIFNGAQIP